MMLRRMNDGVREWRLLVLIVALLSVSIPNAWAQTSEVDVRNELEFLLNRGTWVLDSYTNEYVACCMPLGCPESGGINGGNISVKFENESRWSSFRARVLDLMEHDSSKTRALVELTWGGGVVSSTEGILRPAADRLVVEIAPGLLKPDDHPDREFDPFGLSATDQIQGNASALLGLSSGSLDKGRAFVRFFGTGYDNGPEDG